MEFDLPAKWRYYDYDIRWLFAGSRLYNAGSLQAAAILLDILGLVIWTQEDSDTLSLLK